MITLQQDTIYMGTAAPASGGGGSGDAVWGSITGTLADQTDLQTALNAKQDTLTAGNNITISGDTISATDTTYSAFTGATGSVAGSAGLVPAPAATDNDKYLKGDGTWATVSVDAIANKNNASGATNPLSIWQGTQEEWNTGGGIKDTYYSWAKPVGEDGTLPVTAQWFIAYGNDTYVAVNNSYNATSAYSSDGKHWTTVTHTSSYQANNIGYGDGVFITGRMTTNTFGYSDDNGQTWKESNATQDIIPTQMYSFVYGDGTFVVTGYSRLAFYSTDKGKNWSSSNLPSEGTWYTAYGNGRFVSVKNYSNEAAYSTDNGQTWISMTLPVNDGWTSIAYGNERFVVTNGTSNKVLVLLDNSTIWNNYTITGNTIDSLYGICFDGKQFIGLNNKKVATTIDGEHWNTEYAAITTSSQIISIRTLAYGKDKVIVNTNNEINCMFTFDYVYTTDENPTSSSTLYSEPDVTSLLTITGYYSGYPYYNGYIILSNNDIYTRNEVVNSYYTVAEAYPNYVCNIDNVGLKIGTTDIANKSAEYTAGSNITISNGVISATDTTYSAFGGATGSVAGSAGLVPAPAATDNDKYLKGDGTWAAVSGGGGLQNTATVNGSLTILGTPATTYDTVNIGNGSEAGAYSVAIGSVTGDNDYTTASIESVAIGWGARAYQSSVAIGSNADANSSTNSIAIGCPAYLGNNSYDNPAKATGDNAISIGATAVNYGNNSVAIGCQTYVEYEYDYSIALGYKALASSDYSFDVAFGSSYRYKLLDGRTGKIPNDRINGATGSFTSQDGKTVTVTNGVITSIV